MATPRFHSLPISEVQAQTADAICVAFNVPEALREDYRFVQGQFLTLQARINGEPVRRSYSVCVGTGRYDSAGELRVAIKRVAGGLFSNWANEHLRAGQSIEVMTPDGRFNRPIDPSARHHYLGIAGGSGITPMMSLIETTLEQELASSFTLIYGNRSTASVMFLEELDQLKSRFLARLQVINVLSDEPQEVELFNGVLDQQRCAALLAGLGIARRLDHAFICGPEPMMNAAEAALLAAGIRPGAISVERFGSPLPSGIPQKQATPQSLDTAASADVWLTIDGKTRLVRTPFDGPVILEAGLAAGANLPYACKAGVCCTCRAKVLEGEVRMDKNYTLEADELAQGFVLTCQSHPVSATVRLSYDER